MSGSCPKFNCLRPIIQFEQRTGIIGYFWNEKRHDRNDKHEHLESLSNGWERSCWYGPVSPLQNVELKITRFQQQGENFA